MKSIFFFVFFALLLSCVLSVKNILSSKDESLRVHGSNHHGSTVTKKHASSFSKYEESTGQDDDDDDEEETISTENKPAELNNVEIPVPDTATQGKMFEFQCLKALANSLPAPFCWAKSIYSPKRCPSDYPIRGFGRCRQTKSQTSKFITFLNKKVECEPGDKKSLGVCKSSDRCKKIGYVSCGIGACSQTKAKCVSEITNIVVKSVKGLLKMSAFIASLGTSTAASSFMAVIELFAKMKKSAGYALSAINTIVGTITGFLTQLDPTSLTTLKDKMVAAATEKVKRYLPMVKIEKTDEEITQKVTYVFENIQKVKDETKGITDSMETKIKKVVSDKIDDVKKCFKSVSTDIMKGQLKDVQCYKDYILPIVGMFDPTGISSIVSAFVYPICPHEMSDWTIKL